MSYQRNRVQKRLRLKVGGSGIQTINLLQLAINLDISCYSCLGNRVGVCSVRGESAVEPGGYSGCVF